MEKIIIFNDNDDGNTLRVVKVKNWNPGFNTVVEKARQAWKKSDDELFDIMLPMLKESGFEIEEPEYDELLV